MRYPLLHGSRAAFAVTVVLLAQCAYARHAIPRQTSPKPSPEVQSYLNAGREAHRGNDFREAESGFRKALDKARMLGDAPGERASVRALARVLSESGRPKEAIAFYEEAVALAQKVGSRADEADMLLNMGAVCCDDLHDYSRAQTCFEKALTIYQSLQDRKGELNCRQNLGVVTLNLGQPAKALEQFTTSAAVYRELGDRQGEATAELMCGTALCDSMGNARKAIPHFERARTLYREEKEPRGEAHALHNLGVAHTKLGDLKEAARYTHLALELFRSSRDRQGEAMALNGLGVIYGEMDRHRDAIDVLERALPIHREVGNRFGEGSTLCNLGQLYRDLGENGRALENYARALEVQKDATGYVVANTLGALASLYLSLGQPQQAVRHITRAREIHRSLQDIRGEASDVNLLGIVYGSMGHHREALRYFEQSIAYYRKMDDARAVASDLTNIGRTWYCLGRLDLALRYYRQALPAHRSLGNLRSEAETIANIGEIHAAGDRHREATACYRRAQSIWRSLGSGPKEAGVLVDLAASQEEMGRLREAEQSLSRAVSLLERARQAVGGHSHLKSDFLASRIAAYHRLISLRIRIGRVADAFALSQKAKARSLIDVMQTGQVLHAADMSTDEQATELRLRRRADDLNGLMLSEGVQNKPGAKGRFNLLRHELRHAEQELAAFLDRLYARRPEVARQRAARTATAREIGNLLPADTALVEYVDLGSSRAAHHRRALVIFVVRSGGSVSAVQIDASDLDRHASEFRAACGSPHKAYASLARLLERRLIRPIEPSLSGVKRLIICPDGALWDVPFQALCNTRGKFLIERFEVGYAYSASGLEMALRTAKQRRAKGTLLAMANPAFGDAKRFGDDPGIPGQRPIESPSRPIDSPTRQLLPASILSRAGAIAPLPGTQREADAIRRAFPSAAVFTGRDAQESTAQKELGDYRYVHFATHGYFNDAAPLLSGIVLAQPKDDAHDGFLTAREIFDLRLCADLITLSACNTAKGDKRTGEGLMGLSWALFAAGARSQVVSQWAVDDASTALLMEGLYKRLAGGKSKAGALRGAALSLIRRPALSARAAKATSRGSHPTRRNLRHPYFWAPFILLGDWR